MWRLHERAAACPGHGHQHGIAVAFIERCLYGVGNATAGRSLHAQPVDHDVHLTDRREVDTFDVNVIEMDDALTERHAHEPACPQVFRDDRVRDVTGADQGAGHHEARAVG